MVVLIYHLQVFTIGGNWLTHSSSRCGPFCDHVLYPVFAFTGIMWDWQSHGAPLGVIAFWSGMMYLIGISWSKNGSLVLLIDYTILYYREALAPWVLSTSRYVFDCNPSVLLTNGVNIVWVRSKWQFGAGTQRRFKMALFVGYSFKQGLSISTTRCCNYCSDDTICLIIRCQRRKNERHKYKIRKALQKWNNYLCVWLAIGRKLRPTNLDDRHYWM